MLAICYNSDIPTFASALARRFHEKAGSACGAGFFHAPTLPQETAAQRPAMACRSNRRNILAVQTCGGTGASERGSSVAGLGVAAKAVRCGNTCDLFAETLAANGSCVHWEAPVVKYPTVNNGEKRDGYRPTATDRRFDDLLCIFESFFGSFSDCR